MKHTVKVEMEITNENEIEELIGVTVKEYLEMVLHEALKELSNNNLYPVTAHFDNETNFPTSAHTAAMHHIGYIVGLAELGEKGYTPIHAHGVFETYEKCMEYCKSLNEIKNTKERTALYIVARSMRK